MQQPSKAQITLARRQPQCRGKTIEAPARTYTIRKRWQPEIILNELLRDEVSRMALELTQKIAQAVHRSRGGERKRKKVIQ